MVVTLENIKPILKKILPQLKQDPSRLKDAPSDRHNISWLRIEQATGNHFFRHHAEEFGISVQNAAQLRDYIQLMGEDQARGYLEQVYKEFSEFLDGELDWYIKDINGHRIAEGLSSINVPKRAG